MNWLHFTFKEYRELIQKVKEDYTFEFYSNYDKKEGRHVLWRHDVDMSPHAAIKLAEIEAEEDVVATYFMHLHSPFYNLFEEDVVKCVQQISRYGHCIGLHYDIEFYQEISPDYPKWREMIQEEEVFMWDVFGFKPMAVSFHNVSLLDVSLPREETIWGDIHGSPVHGLVNTDSDYIRSNYEYCSDSNGRWNCDIHALLKRKPPRLHILTHPEWWSQTPMLTIQKVEKCIEDRHKYQKLYYDDILRKINKI